MATYMLFGTYSVESLKSISAARTHQAKTTIEKLKGSVKGIYALLGEYDLVLIVDLPGVKEAMQASIELGKLTGIGFTTSAAVPVEEFDTMVS